MKNLLLVPILLSLLMMSCQGGKLMNQGPFTITASFDADEGGLRHLLRLDHTGRADLVIESNVLEPATEAIGVYRAEIGKERAQEFRGVWAALSSRSMPESQPVPPGSTMVLVSLEEAGSTKTWMIEPSSSPPAMCKAAERFREVGKEAEKNPVREIRLKASLDKTVIERSTSVKVTIKLTAEGVEHVSVVNPLTAPRKRTGGFTLWGVRSDLPPADIWPQHSIHKVLTSELLAASHDHIKEEFLMLPPGQTSVYEFNVPITWEPGEYAVKVIFESLYSADKVLKGKIVSLPAKVKVQ